MKAKKRAAKSTARRKAPVRATLKSGSGKTRRGAPARAKAPRVTAAPAKAPSAARAEAQAKYSQTGAPWWKAHL